MSHVIYLLGEDGRTLPVPKHEEGGTYAVGGISEASLNVTYNYGRSYHRTVDPELGIRWLDGKKAKDTVEQLRTAVKTLGTVRDADYWASTDGNAGFALSILLSWAERHPEGRWRVT